MLVHTSVLFDPKKREFVENVSIEVDPEMGNVVALHHNSKPEVRDGDIDLRGKVVCPGFVEAHSHIFLHSYE